MKKNIGILALLLITLVPIALCQTQAVEQAYQKVLASTELKHGVLGLSVIELETNKKRIALNDQQSLIPASSLKVITSFTALAILGENYTFKTEIAHDGTLSPSGVLDGNLYLIGYGDPTLGSDKMEGVLSYQEILKLFAEKVAAAGIKEIKGAIIGDGTFFETALQAPTWQWNDIGNYYAAGASGLNLNENLYYLEFQLGSQLSTAPKLLNTNPEIPYLQMDNELKSAGKGTGDNAYVYGSPYTYHRFIRGTLPIGSGKFKIKGAIPDPPFFTAYHFMKTLEAKGIKTGLYVKTQREMNREGTKTIGEKKMIYTHQSPKLKEIVNRANLESVNLYLESMLKILGKQKKGEGSTEKGLVVVQEFWEARGINFEGFQMKDGSGLSPRTVIPTNTLAQLMRKMALDKKVGKTFLASLPVAGKTGTMKNMLKGTAAEGRMKAKSGSMSGVRSYTGVVTNKAGKTFAFAIIANNFSGKSSAMRKKIETILAEIAKLP